MWSACRVSTWGRPYTGLGEGNPCCALHAAFSFQSKCASCCRHSCSALASLFSPLALHWKGSSAHSRYHRAEVATDPPAENQRENLLVRTLQHGCGEEKQLQNQQSSCRAVLPRATWGDVWPGGKKRLKQEQTRDCIQQKRSLFKEMQGGRLGGVLCTKHECHSPGAVRLMFSSGKSSVLQGRLLLCRHSDTQLPINVQGSEQRAGCMHCSPRTC